MTQQTRLRGYATDRSEERLRAHWEVERELADRLRGATPEERATFYGSVYDELFQRIPDHPQLQWKADAAQRRASAAQQAALIRRFTPPNGVFLEIGAGDCAVSLAVAQYASRVYAIEVSREIADLQDVPPNFELVITDGRSIPATPVTVDLVYSNQLMEHLHPDDAVMQVNEIFAALAPGGRYLCFTPNRLLGPGDISKYFEDEVARGFHLREYDNRELRDLLRTAGFTSIEVVARFRGSITTLPLRPFAASEACFEALPLRARKRLKHSRVVHKLLSPGGGVIATKR